ncbi:MAG TPA: hypothetical protein VI072_04780 [Polyangiaceae bacterium]
MPVQRRDAPNATAKEGAANITYIARAGAAALGLMTLIWYAPTLKREVRAQLDDREQAYLELWSGTPKYLVATGISGTLVVDARMRALEAKGVQIVNTGCEGGNEQCNAVILEHFGVR